MSVKVGTIESGVLFGHQGQLFLADGGHDILNFVLRKRPIDIQSVNNFKENIETRQTFCSAQGIKYCHVIFPDKQSVLTSEFPFANPACLGEEYLGRHPSLLKSVIYPRDLLRSKGVRVFQQTDTHLTDLGTSLVAAEVVRKVVAPDADHLAGRLIAGISSEAEWVGDLGRRFSPPVSERRPVFTTSWGSAWFHNELDGGNNGLVDIRVNTQAPYRKRLLVIGDSFGRELGRVLSFFIREVVFLRSPFFHPEMCTQISPDILVTDNVERYLSWCAPDTERPPFMLYPYIGGHNYRPEPQFIEALCAVLSYPGKRYEDFMRKFAG